MILQDPPVVHPNWVCLVLTQLWGAVKKHLMKRLKCKWCPVEFGPPGQNIQLLPWRCLSLGCLYTRNKAVSSLKPHHALEMATILPRFIDRSNHLSCGRSLGLLKTRQDGGMEWGCRIFSLPSQAILDIIEFPGRYPWKINIVINKGSLRSNDIVTMLQENLVTVTSGRLGAITSFSLIASTLLHSGLRCVFVCVSSPFSSNLDCHRFRRSEIYNHSSVPKLIAKSRHFFWKRFAIAEMPFRPMSL